MDDLRRFEDAATLLGYPEAAARDGLLAAAERLGRGDDGLGRAARRLGRLVRERPAHELEEAYTRTFDMGRACTLELGWHLYGEDYERGTFLVAMRHRLREAGVDEGRDLPDHLVPVLRLLPHLTPEEAQGFVAPFVVPAMRRMLAAYQDDDNAWRRLLVGVVEALVARWGEEEHATTVRGSAPYDACRTCTAVATPGEGS